MAYHLAYMDVAPVTATWEWNKYYSLRSVIYPAYLSLPLHLLRLLGIDTNFLVNNSMVFMNTLLVVVGDYYLYYMS